MADSAIKPLPNFPKANNIVELTVYDDCKAELKIQFGDGSKATQELQETSGTSYVVVNNSKGEHYRIVPSTGNFQMFDKDGLIGVVKKLENRPKPGECWTLALHGANGYEVWLRKCPRPHRHD